MKPYFRPVFAALWWCCCCIITTAQPRFALPILDSLHASIDTYFNQLTQAQAEEWKAQHKHRWLAYIPNPGYSPFTGGFSVSFNLAAPLAEVKANHLLKQKLAALDRLNQLQAATLKNEVVADYRALVLAIQDFEARDTLVQLKQKSFQLAQKQYERAELTPTEYINRQYEIEALQVQRLSDASAIHKQILQLLIKSKAALAANKNGP